MSGDAEISNVRPSRDGGSGGKVPSVDKRRVPLVLFHRALMSIRHLLVKRFCTSLGLFVHWSVLNQKQGVNDKSEA